MYEQKCINNVKIKLVNDFIKLLIFEINITQPFKKRQPEESV